MRLRALRAALTVVAALSMAGSLHAQTATLPAGAKPSQAEDPPVTVDPQVEALVRQAYVGVAPSIVCIRTVVTRDLPMVLPQTGMMGMVKTPLALHGTGVVIDSTVEAGGQTEYLILTNDHVANPSLYFDVHGRLVTELKQSATTTSPDVSEKSSIVDDSNDEDASDDIQLRVIARSPGGDVALMETVHTPRRLAVFRGKIGFGPDEVKPGDLVITTGFPYGERARTAFGRILDTHVEHNLGVPHLDYSVNTPLEPGQSGSPVFRVEVSGPGMTPEVRFDLIGLLHARQSGTHLMVPYPDWAGALAALPSHERIGLMGGQE